MNVQADYKVYADSLLKDAHTEKIVSSVSASLAVVSLLVTLAMAVVNKYYGTSNATTGLTMLSGLVSLGCTIAAVELNKSAKKKTALAASRPQSQSSSSSSQVYRMRPAYR